MTVLGKNRQSECKIGNGKSGGKIEWKLSEVNIMAVSGGQNELIGEFKMAAVDVISISGIGYGIHVHSNRN